MRRLSARLLAASAIACAAAWSSPYAQTPPATPPAAAAPETQPQAAPVQVPAPTPAPATPPAVAAPAPAAPVLAPAAPVTEENGRALAAALKAGLNRWLPPASDDFEGLAFEWDGEPTVKVAGDHYDIALPRLSMESSDGVRVELGTILVSVTPKPGTQFAIDVAFPNRFTVQQYDEEEDDYQDAATVAIGSQRFKAVWSGALETLLSADAALGDVTATSPKGKGGLSIGSITLVQDLKQDGATTWSGPSAFSIGNVTALDDKKQEVFKLGGLAMENSYLRADLAKITELQRLSQKVATGGFPTVAEVLPLLRGSLGGATMKLRLTGLNATDPSDGTKVSLGQFALRTGIDGLDQEQSTASFGMESRDFSMTPSPAPSNFTPKSAEFQFSLAKLPNAALWQAFADLLSSVEAEEKAKAAAKPAKGKKGAEPPPSPAAAAAAAAGEAAMMRALAALNEAGSELRLDKVAVEAPAVSGSATGAVRMAAQAAMGATGGATILLRGIDAAVKALQPAPGKKPDKESQDLLGMLTMVQMMGQMGKDDSGAEVRSYKIDLTEQGQLLLNGADMGPMLGGAAAPAAPAPAPKK